MFSQNDKISIRQLQVLLILTLFSSLSLTLPRIAAEYADQNGWQLIVGSTVLVIFYSIIITSLGKMFPTQTLVEYAQDILSKPIGILLVFILIVRLLIFGSIQLRLFSELVKQTLLHNTPIEIIMISMLFTAIFLTRKGYEPRARLAEIVIFLVLIPIVVILLFALPEVKVDYLAPYFTIKASDFIRGSIWISLNLGGIELLYYAIPYLRQPQKVTRAVVQSVIFTGLLNLVICIVTVGLFGAAETKRQIWPVMTMMQTIELPGAFIERQDALMMSFWIIATFALINCFIFFITIATGRLFKAKELHWINLLIVPILYVLALVPDNVPQTFEWQTKMYQYTGILYVLPIPILLIIIAKIRKLGVKNASKS